MSITIHMITILADICNQNFSQMHYDDLTSNLQIHSLKCPCGHASCLTYHGYYSRSLKYGTCKIDLRIRRVLCSLCKSTHALLPAFIIPYSQISLHHQVAITACFEHKNNMCTIMDETPAIDESNIRYVIRQYKRHWRERLKAVNLALTNTLYLVSQCFSHFNRQFMQIKRTPNTFFLVPT